MSVGAGMLAAAATVCLLRVPGIEAYSALQEPSSRSLDNISTLQDAKRESPASFEDPDSHLSLSGMFSHGRKEKTTPSSTSSTPDEASTSHESPPDFNIDTFTFNKANIRKTNDIFSLLADVDGTDDAKYEREGQIQVHEETTGDNKSDQKSLGVPVASAANIPGKNILLATKDMEGLLSVVQKMKKKLEGRLERTVVSTSPTDESSSSPSGQTTSSSPSKQTLSSSFSSPSDHTTSTFISDQGNSSSSSNSAPSPPSSISTSLHTSFTSNQGQISSPNRVQTFSSNKSSPPTSSSDSHWTSSSNSSSSSSSSPPITRQELPSPSRRRKPTTSSNTRRNQNSPSNTRRNQTSSNTRRNQTPSNTRRKQTSSNTRRNQAVPSNLRATSSTSSQTSSADATQDKTSSSDATQYKTSSSDSTKSQTASSSTNSFRRSSSSSSPGSTSVQVSSSSSPSFDSSYFDSSSSSSPFISLSHFPLFSLSHFPSSRHFSSFSPPSSFKLMSPSVNGFSSDDSNRSQESGFSTTSFLSNDITSSTKTSSLSSIDSDYSFSSNDSDDFSSSTDSNDFSSSSDSDDFSSSNDSDDFSSSSDSDDFSSSDDSDDFSSSNDSDDFSSSNDTSPPSSSPPSPSALMNLLLDTSTLERIRTAGLTSETEDEFLDHLLEVLTGEKNRQGTALTLDPVTVIALLTLAAYLIRAVYQILTVTGRSLEVNDMLLPLQMSDVPDAMVQIHNWISASNVAHVREERSFHPLSTILTVPGNLAAVIKLQREGHRACVKQFLCEQIQERPYREITFADILIAGLGYYFGDTELGTYIDRTLSYDTSCEVVPYGCSPRTLSDAHYLEDLYSRASFKFFDLLAVMSNYL